MRKTLRGLCNFIVRSGYVSYKRERQIVCPMDKLFINLITHISLYHKSRKWNFKLILLSCKRHYIFLPCKTCYNFAIILIIIFVPMCQCCTFIKDIFCSDEHCCQISHLTVLLYVTIKGNSIKLSLISVLFTWRIWYRPSSIILNIVNPFSG